VLRLSALVLAVFVALAAVAVAAPRDGVYIDPPLQIYITTKGNKIKSLQAPCVHEGSQQGSFTLKGLKLSKKGKFHYKGKVKVASTTSFKVSVDLKGKVKKKATGSYSFTDQDAYCSTTKFSAKYYAKHPQG
jgi:hypothetical protein